MSSSPTGLDWQFTQAFGEKEPVDEELADADVISSIQFSSDGSYIATGDRGGRVVLFNKTEGKDPRGRPEYTFFSEFQSHEPEFDYLKSLEIEEKINKIRWLPQGYTAHHLLSTNDKTIKLWKVYEKEISSFDNANFPFADDTRNTRIDSLKVPTVSNVDSVVAASQRHVFANAHAYHINSIALNSDAETFISVDDLRINLWHLEQTVQSFNIVDIKPENMEDLSEVITAAEFHPTSCNLFMYSSSKGNIKLVDMRENALCHRYAKNFDEPCDADSKSFFSEIISSISDVKFAKDGMNIVSRDYLTLKVWDVRVENKPVTVVPIHDHLRSKLCDLYESDFIFDRFEVSVSGDGEHYLSGTYHNCFSIFTRAGQTSARIEASKVPVRKASTKAKLGLGRKRDKRDEVNPDTINFQKKILRTDWHPLSTSARGGGAARAEDNCVAVAAANHLYLYSASP